MIILEIVLMVWCFGGLCGSIFFYHITSDLEKPARLIAAVIGFWGWPLILALGVDKWIDRISYERSQKDD